MTHHVSRILCVNRAGGIELNAQVHLCFSMLLNCPSI